MAGAKAAGDGKPGAPGGAAAAAAAPPTPPGGPLRRAFARLTSRPPISRPEGRWCPEEGANPLSKALFIFANSLVKMGSSKHLEQADLWDTARRDDPGRVWGGFNAALRATAGPEARQGQLWRALWRVHGRAFVITGLIKLLHDAIMFSQPFILEQLLKALGGGAGGAGAGGWRVTLGLSFALLAAALLEALTINVYFNALFRMSLHVKTELLELLYSKSLRLASSVKAAMGVGPIVNLQSNDAAKIWMLPGYGHMVWNGPFQIIVVMALLIRILSIWPALAGLLVTIALLPMTMGLGKLLARVRRQSIAAADARVKLVTEVITGIKAIKLYAWEEPYSERIGALREAELRAIRRTQLLGMINMSVFSTGPVLVSLAAFGVYAALGRPLTAAVAFPSLALFNLLRFPIVMIPQQIMNMIAASVGVGRIQKFMDAAEQEGVAHLGAPAGAAAAGGPGDGPAFVSAEGKPPAAAAAAPAAAPAKGAANGAAPAAAPAKGAANGAAPAAAPAKGAANGAARPAAAASDAAAAAASDAAVVIRGGNFSWSEAGPPVLRDLDLSIKKGSLTIVVGPVGSGKSSLLSAILGEMSEARASEAAASDGGAAASDGGAGAPAVVAAAPDADAAATAAEATATDAGAGAQERVAPSVAVAGSVAYTAQDPWIQNATLKANVLMGAPFDGERYAATIHAACLEKDLEMLPAGDESEIGEKGINLSGGQKHRVALARAAYAGADVYLLDDPLSAVDAHVGRWLFDECVCGALEGATRVLVTHQLQFLPRADQIVVMLDGRIAHAGSYPALLAAGVDLASLVPLPTADEGGEGVETGAGGSPAKPKQGAASPLPPQKQQPAPPAQQPAAPSPPPQPQPQPPAAAPNQPRARLALFSKPSPQPRPGPPALARGEGSMPRLMALPSFLTRTLAAGGSFASHKPSRKGDAITRAAAAATGGGANGAAAGDVELGAAKLAASDAAAAAASAGDYGGAKAEADAETEAEAELLPPPGAGAGKKGVFAGRLGRLVAVEHRAKGSVKRSVYLAYLSAWGPLFLLPAAITLGSVAERGMQVLQNFVLSVWSDATSAAKDNLDGAATARYLGLYFGLGLGSVAVVLVRSGLLVIGSIAASRTIHARLLAKILRLPMGFFDSQPTGRLVNRFTKDTEALDTQMSAAVNSALACLVGVAGSVAAVAAVSPYVLVALVPLAVLYYRVQRLYIATSRELKRLDSVAFSPIFQHYGETLTGLPTIRAFGRQDFFASINRTNLEESNRAWWPIQLLNRWLSMRLELTGAMLVFFTAVAVGVLLPRNAGLAGFALTSALNLTGTLAWLVRQTTELEVAMNSVERMVEYQDEAEEAPALTAVRPPPLWPQHGAITATKLQVRYRPDLPLVLKGISFEVAARQKVGICGRTGCGKSTLMMTLFRILEPCGGSITIDGVDIGKIGLRDLRSRLSLVPQDPVIFSGSVRSNLDPFGEAPGDGAIWEALRRAGVDDAVRALGSGLDSSIQEGGTNLSAGQRQLLCMARALLRSTRVLVLDEATSNVDAASDALIQATIRTAFADCTVLTIAHRLHTIGDADRVMVLDAGQLVEFDSPGRLMGVRGGVFRGMVEEAGRSRATGSDE
ncbi:canalicular multispecific organic anion transporter [Raphidocelis subcapitata]|uniref:Canalicular multispecific organic anion transporter n=1 Tax=Raphidocelis subcapitata TaxID=307507 RepID=A0A2V0NPK0_9CHLO|nr:canalicular multispecific organic anion transporter [Raphidocelis subcapitata]|eukprot:GBF89551.1 canalicular multispecific organic anion transporter [Raphidocelis subcapitata]